MNLVEIDFLTKISAMPVTMNAGMLDAKNNNPRSYDVILKSINSSIFTVICYKTTG